MAGREDYKEEQAAASAILAGRTTATLAKVDISTATTTTVIAAPGAGLKIKILKYLLVADAANTIILQDDTTALTGAMTVNAGGGLGGDHDFTPIILTANKAFKITTSAAEQLSGYVLYISEA